MNDFKQPLTLSLSEITVNYIEGQIMSGNYLPGDKVNEHNIAQELNISRAPIREALKELNMKGILDFKPRRGSSVVVLDERGINEVFDLRVLIESDIVRILMEDNLLSDNDIRELRYKADEMSKLANRDKNDTNTIYTLNKMDLDFHTYLWSKAKRPRSARLLRDLYMQLLIVMNKDKSKLDKIEEKAQEHHKLIDIILTGKVGLAEDELKDHIYHYRGDLYTG